MVLALDDPAVSNPLGEVLRLPCKFIKGKSDAQPILIQAIAQELRTTGKNVLPVMVKSLEEERYQAVFNVQILEAARQAKLDFVWCIVIDDLMAAQLRVESGQIVRLNLIAASEKDLVGIFEYIKVNKSGFSKINPEAIGRAIIEYRSQKQISSLEFLTKLKCGIGKAKLSTLSENLLL